MNKKTLLEVAEELKIDYHKILESAEKRFQVRPENMSNDFFYYEMAIALAVRDLKAMDSPSFQDAVKQNFDPNSVTLISGNRVAEVKGNEVKFSRLTEKGRGLKRLYPVLSEKPYDIAVNWIKNGIKPKIETKS